VFKVSLKSHESTNKKCLLEQWSNVGGPLSSVALSLLILVLGVVQLRMFCAQ